MQLFVQEEVWPLKGVFRIAHGARTHAHTVTVTIKDDYGNCGRGECVPYPRYGESPLSVVAQIEAIRPAIENGIDRHKLLEIMPACAARNAIDCALWDFEAKKTGKAVWELAGLSKPEPVLSAFTIIIDEKEKMIAAAIEASKFPLLKIKIGGAQDLESVYAIHEARRDARFIIDANESLDEVAFNALCKRARDLGIELIEQPFKVNNDQSLKKSAAPVAICADESFHTGADIEKTVQAYDALNVKLDKTGGFTEALRAINSARAAGQKVMMGCMVGTSLVTAPAVILGGLVDWVDLDGPLFLANDRQFGLEYNGALISPPSPELWG